MAYLSKKGDAYYVRKSVKVNGRFTTEWISLGKIPLAQARIKLLQYQTGAIKTNVSKLTIKDLAAEFNDWQLLVADKKPYSVARDVNHLRQVCKEFGGVRIHKFDPDAFIKWARRREFKPKTVWHYAGSTRLMYKYAIEKGYIDHNPANKIIKPKIIRNPPKYISEDVLWLIIAEIGSSHRAPFEIMIYAGLRPAECLQLQVKNVDLKNNALDLYPDQTKTAERGIIPIHPALLPVLKNLIKGKKLADYLFPSKFQAGHQTECKKALGLACQRLSKRLGEKIHVTPYQFRHTFATRLLEKTQDIRTVQQLMRHADISMTTRYATALDQRLRDAIDKL